MAVTDDEMAAIQAITTEQWIAYGPVVDQHIGDLAWELRATRETANVRLIDDRAFTLDVPDEWLFLGARPGHEDLYDELIDPDAMIGALDGETAKLDALRRHGFEPVEGHEDYQFVIDLTELVPLSLPGGWSIREGVTDVEARVALHRAAWEPSQFTLEMYEVVRSTTPYRPDLDVAIVSDEGDWASYCIAWLDERAATGRLEPVGTAPAYRRKGLAHALLTAALHRLHDAGAHTCVVSAVVNPHNPGPPALYESIGGRANRFGRRYKRP